MTSILRTYYAWQTVQSRDISYNVAKTSFWTYAEIAFGTVVSCMPVLPRFFQHFGSKIRTTFASKSKPGCCCHSNLRQARSLPPPPVGMDSLKSSSSLLSLFEKFFQKGGEGGETCVSETWSEACHPSPVMVKSEHVTLDEYDAVLVSREVTVGESAPQIAHGTTTKRDDMERG